MGIELKQQLRQGQTLIMTPQLQQAVKMLQMNTVELNELVEHELQENPMLDVDETTPAENAPPTEAEIDAVQFATYLDSGAERAMPNFNKFKHEMPSYEATLTRKDSLEDFLIWQLRMLNLDETGMAVAVFLIGNIDDRGYLTINDEAAAEQLKVDPALVKKVVAMLQGCDPAGVGAHDLKECLGIQAKRQFGEHSLATRLVLEFLPELETKNYQRISRKLNLPEEDVKAAVREIVTLNPKPGRGYSTEEPSYITPDIYIEKINDDYVIKLNDSGMPRLRINQLYRSVARQKGVTSDAKEFIQDKLSAATSLIKSIHQRQRTIFRVTESIFKFQREFLEKGVAHLRPLVLRDVAEDVGLHEGTVGRVTTNKYVHTPRGIFELKYFFNPGIQRNDGQADMASEAVKEAIRKILQTEDPRNPLSDQAVVELLKEQNINIARRTVTKYRELMGILPSNKRKQLV
jgi:RNA polymerase sigma-54 factor